MAQRSDGLETQHRILEAACRVFAQKGFREATVAEICRAAGANSALVNYHFRDKESLYVAVWEHAARQADALYPIDGGAPPTTSAEVRLKHHLRAVLSRVMDHGKMGFFHRLRMQELAAPTGYIDRVRARIIRSARQYTCGLIGELLGPQATEQDIELCHLTLIGPCLMAGHAADRRLPIGGPELARMELERLLDHITSFALAGIRSVRARIQRQSNQGTVGKA
jgi:AcrR family transcriptional regulator